MRRLYIIVLLILCAASTFAVGRPDGFVSLFNGKSLDGWTVMGDKAGFQVADGCILSEGGKGGSWIRYDKPFANFILRMEWMLSKVGNSGIFIRSWEKSPGVEIQLLAPWTPYRDDLHCTGSLYGFVPVSNRPDETPLHWRKIEITCAYKHVTVAIDGIKCTEADYDQVPSMKDLPLTGYVGMQDSHTGPGEWVKFRNIQIKDLDRDPAFVASGLTSSDPAIRKVAYDATLRLGPPMAPLLLDILSRDEPIPAHAARMALFYIVGQASAPGARRQASEVRKALLTRLSGKGDLNGQARTASAQLLGIIGADERRTVDTLKKALLEGGSVSAAALEALQRIPGRRATDVLIDVLRRNDAPDRAAVALALGARKDLRALPALTDLAQHETGDMQIAAIRALGALGSERAVPVLRKIAESGPEIARRTAADILLMLNADLTPLDSPRS